MKKMMYRDRIALSYMLVTALLLLLLFVFIYFLVSARVYKYIDHQLDAVALKHLNEVAPDKEILSFYNKAEWEEREHQVADVNPVFITLYDSTGEVADKSPNLKQEHLKLRQMQELPLYYNTVFNQQAIRQVQVPVKYNGQTAGYLAAAMSTEGYLMVLRSLLQILIISYPLTLLILFFLARYLAGKSIQPIRDIILQMSSIRQDTLNLRIIEPETNDELQQLSSSINALLNRIEQGFLREKQFTADAAHQLKTPLAVLKGSLEVLLRKPRGNEEYQQKIVESVEEIDRMWLTVEQLLMLARVDGKQHQVNLAEVSLIEMIDNVIQRFSRKIQQRGMRIRFEPETDFVTTTDPFLMDIILENLISNAIKYSFESGEIEIKIIQQPEGPLLSIADEGIGIAEPDLERIFDPFYRSEPFGHPAVKGDGLGLSIVRRACRLLSIQPVIQSKQGAGTKVLLQFSVKP